MNCSGWFASFDAYRSGNKGKDASHWLSIHGGRPWAIDRKTGKSFFIKYPAVSLCGTIELATLKRAMAGQAASQDGDETEAEHISNGLLPGVYLHAAQASPVLDLRRGCR